MVLREEEIKLRHLPAGTTGQVVSAAQSEASERGIKFNGIVITPGWTAESSISTARDFINANYVEGENIILYGYSYGGDFAVELADKLKEDNITVDLLITVDSSDGSLQNSTINTTIPENVLVNTNIYQTNNSGSSSSSCSSSNSSGNRDSGSSNSPGSKGGPNSASNPEKTVVNNANTTGRGVNHMNIDEKYLQSIIQIVKDFMSTSN